MRRGVFLILMITSFAFEAQASDPESAYRDPDTSYTIYESRASQIKNTSLENAGTPISLSRLYNEESLPSPTSWKASSLQKRFEDMRDKPIIEVSEEATRRLSWMYPDDGCFARAALANRIFFKMFVPIPKKVFAFGNLKVETKNSPRGYVSWWYHVAPIVEVDDVKYVLDPSIEPMRPLKLKEWLEKMGTPEEIKVAICDNGTYSPRDNCQSETDGLEKRAETTQRHYLKKEESRLISLGRSPEEELGENPPW